MNTDKTFEYAASNLQDTLSFAQKLGGTLKGGAVIELKSDVGGGKTTFVTGLMKGLGSDDQVSSPTFTISKQYSVEKKGLTVHHFDFYRLNDAGLMKAELGESLSDDKVITIIEWAGIVEDVLPVDRLTIEITSTGEYSRMFSIRAGMNHSYVVEGLA